MNTDLERKRTAEAERLGKMIMSLVEASTDQTADCMREAVARFNNEGGPFVAHLLTLDGDGLDSRMTLNLQERTVN